MKRIVAAVALFSMAPGCAGRAPAPVPVVQVHDRNMDCAAISAEAQANANKIQSLGSEEGGKVAQNVVAGVAGLFIPVLWFAMDFQGAAGKETAALQSRQQYLATMADQRNCGTATATTIPAAPVR